jgi:hypothetical protein
MRIGSPQSVRVAMAFLSVWAVIGIVTIAIAASDLPT